MGLLVALVILILESERLSWILTNEKDHRLSKEFEIVGQRRPDKELCDKKKKDLNSLKIKFSF